MGLGPRCAVHQMCSAQQFTSPGSAWGVCQCLATSNRPRVWTLAYRGQMPYLLTPQHVLNVPFSYCDIISMLYNWKCRSKTAQWSNNILKDPGSFCLSALPFSDCWLLFSSLSSRGKCGCCNNTSFAHTAASQAEGMLSYQGDNLFYQGEKTFQKSFSPR